VEEGERKNESRGRTESKKGMASGVKHDRLRSGPVINHHRHEREDRNEKGNGKSYGPNEEAYLIIRRSVSKMQVFHPHREFFVVFVAGRLGSGKRGLALWRRENVLRERGHRLDAGKQKGTRIPPSKKA
jgi:hypothetical protein